MQKRITHQVEKLMQRQSPEEGSMLRQFLIPLVLAHSEELCINPPAHYIHGLNP